MFPKIQSVIAVVIVLGLAMLSCQVPGTGPSEATIIALTVEARPPRTQAPGTPVGPPQTDSPSAQLPTLTPAGPATAADTVAPPATTPAQTPCDRASFVTDVTVPDGTDFHAGQTFSKTWRLRNNGTCTWTSGYSLIFDHGDAMGAPASLQLTTGTVAPGQSIDVSVDLTAPASVGTYRGYFLLRNPSGVVFGIGANADVAFWVEIEVVPLAVTIAPIFPIITGIFILFHSSGTDQVLADNSCFDLDAGSAVGCGAGSADFRYVALMFTRQAQPLHGTSFGYALPSAPSKTDCQTGGISTTNRDLTVGSYYCYQTSDGRWGRLLVDALSISSMSFDWVTFN